MNFDVRQNEWGKDGNQREIEHQAEREIDHQADRWIDDALAQFVEAEPQPGLDARVLARLRGAQEESARTIWWWGVPAFGAAVALMLAALWLARMESRTAPAMPVAKVTAATSVIANAKTTHAGLASADRSPKDLASRDRADIKPELGDAGDDAPSRIDHGISGKHSFDRSSVAIANARIKTGAPKLEHFPSRRNLSEQEWLLVRYLNAQSTSESSRRKALLEDTTARAVGDPNIVPDVDPQVDLNANLHIDSLEIHPLQITEIEISQDQTN